MYPSEETLKTIGNYDINNPVKTLIEIVEREWKYAEDGYFKLSIKGDKVYLQLHTAGWSGNEDIYSAFHNIRWIGMFWQKSIRGGHYYYTFPKYVYETGFRGISKESKICTH